MSATIWQLAAVSFLLGVFAKYADLMHEHGLPQPFPGARYLSGVLWGICGIGMIVVSPLAGLTYVAHVLYWFERGKLETTTHAMAGVLMVLGAFWFEGQFFSDHRAELVGVFLGYWITGLAQTYFKTRYPATRAFWRLRLRIYAVPFVYCLYVDSIEPMIATGFGMIACEIITYRYRHFDAVHITPEGAVAS